MIFSSPEFCLVFLPLTVVLYYFLLRCSYKKYISLFIFVVSLIYYAWWMPDNVIIIICSIVVNYIIGKFIAESKRYKKILFITGILFNLCLLGWYKYSYFFISNINMLLSTSISLQEIILPIGISFYTFQQIAYISDIYTGRYNPDSEGVLNYCCFICFFPQLVAGPIVHHQEMMPQFYDSRNHHICWKNIFYGIIIFQMGLAKKLLIADNLSPISRYCFDSSPSMTFLEASFASIAYTLQLYFDFSGYSDMAVGAALLFNVHLPWNFNSPYKATDIQDFWRRWHITLSRWLREYLYIPLGGNRNGTSRTLCNLFLTFLLGGLWHGAAWTFILWGALHGLALIIHRLWIRYGYAMPYLAAWLLTFAFVNMAWIVFRAPSIERLAKFAKAFLGWNGFGFRASFRESIIAQFGGSGSFTMISLFVLSCLSIALLGPNSFAIKESSPRKLLIFAVILSIFCLLFLIIPPQHPEFIYSQF